MIIDFAEPVLVTGATGFLGFRVVARLLDCGFRNVRCFARPFSDVSGLEALRSQYPRATLEIVRGDLLSRGDCEVAVKNVAVIYHLAAGTRQKSVSDACKNSVTTTRNLLDATLGHGCLRRFVNVSSFAVYTNRGKRRKDVLDETCPIEEHPEFRGEAYCYAKAKQDDLVIWYGMNHQIPYVLVRPGSVYGPSRPGITGRIGLWAFGIFLHFGGSNVIPFTYVDNCANAVVLAGLRSGVDGEVFNVVDDDLPTSRQFLRLYKKHVGHFRSVPVPRFVSYGLCFLSEKYSMWAGRDLSVLNRRAWHAYWRGSRYTNAKVKESLGWTPVVPTAEALQRYFESCRKRTH